MCIDPHIWGLHVNLKKKKNNFLLFCSKSICANYQVLKTILIFFNCSSEQYSIVYMYKSIDRSKQAEFFPLKKSQLSRTSCNIEATRSIQRMQTLWNSNVILPRAYLSDIQNFILIELERAEIQSKEFNKEFLKKKGYCVTVILTFNQRYTTLIGFQPLR